MMNPAIYELFNDIVSGPEENINLAEAALLIAGNEYARLDIPYYLGFIDQLAETLDKRINHESGNREIIDIANNFLFEEIGFSGNFKQFNDPKNSFLNDVLETKLGIPITLSVLYMEIGKRIGIKIKGISFPGHFIVKLQRDNEVIFLDPFSRGMKLDNDELQHRLRHFSSKQRSNWDMQELLIPAKNNEILARMLRNLKLIYLSGQDHEKALDIVNFLLCIYPDSVTDIRDRASIYESLECFQAAEKDYQQYLMLSPEADDIVTVQSRLLELRGHVSRLH